MARSRLNANQVPAIDNTVIGGTTPAAGSFTNLTVTGDAYPRQATPTSISATATLTAAQIATNTILYTGAAGGTLTLPTGSSLDTQFASLAVDQAFDFSVISTVAFAATLAVNTGVTSSGSLTVAANTSGRFRLRKTGTATYVIYRLS